MGTAAGCGGGLALAPMEARWLLLSRGWRAVSSRAATPAGWVWLRVLDPASGTGTGSAGSPRGRVRVVHVIRIRNRFQTRVKIDNNFRQIISMVHDCRPRLFVYRLPESYRDPLESVGGMPPDGLGRPLRMRDSNGNVVPGLWDSEQYSVASLVHERALAYRCRTHDPAEADLFFVPAFKARLGATQSCAEPGGANGRRGLLQRLKLELPNASRPANWASREAPTTLDARGGADHIIINPRNGMTWERNPFCELNLGAAQLGAALYLAMEQGPRNGSRWVYPEGYCGQVCVPAYRPQLLPEPWYWSVPWTSTVHLDLHAGHTPPWASTHARPVLVAALFGTSHKPILPKPTLQLRERLISQCKAASAAHCQYSLPKSAAATARIYWDSTFCLQPGGDSISRKGMVDSLLLGCIPVLFHEGQKHQWPWHWGSWVRDATVTLNQSLVRSRELDAIQYLAKMPTAKVHALQVAIRKHAHRLHYAAIDTANLPAGLRGWASPDAFEVILEGAWRLARDNRLQTLGRALQRTRGSGSAFNAISARRVKLAAAVNSEDDSSGGLDAGVLDGADALRRRRVLKAREATAAD